jgi:hypothetical protein
MITFCNQSLTKDYPVAGASESLPIGSKARILKSKAQFSSLKEGISSSKIVHGFSDGLCTKARPIASDAHILKSKEDLSSLKEGISSSKMVHGKSGGHYTKASLPSPKETNCSVQKRKYSELSTSESIGVGKYRAASWMNGDSADGRRHLMRSTKARMLNSCI